MQKKALMDDLVIGLIFLVIGLAVASTLVHVGARAELSSPFQITDVVKLLICLGMLVPSGVFIYRSLKTKSN